MARYSALLGRPVEVQYRAGAIVLPASGIFVADSGRSIFLEQHLDQHGHGKQFRWEIPYQYIVRIREPLSGEVPQVDASPVPSGSASASPSSADAQTASASAAAAGAGSSSKAL